MYTGIQVEEGEFPDHDHLYCRLFWVGDPIKIYIFETRSIYLVSGLWPGLAPHSWSRGGPFTGEKRPVIKITRLRETSASPSANVQYDLKMKQQLFEFEFDTK